MIIHRSASNKQVWYYAARTCIWEIYGDTIRYRVHALANTYPTLSDHTGRLNYGIVTSRGEDEITFEETGYREYASLALLQNKFYD